MISTLKSLEAEQNAWEDANILCPDITLSEFKAEYVSFCEVAIGSVYYVKRQNKTNFPNTLLVEKPTHVLYSPPHRQETHMGVSNAPIKLWRFANILWFAL